MPFWKRKAKRFYPCIEGSQVTWFGLKVIEDESTLTLLPAPFPIRYCLSIVTFPGFVFLILYLWEIWQLVQGDQGKKLTVVLMTCGLVCYAIPALATIWWVILSLEGKTRKDPFLIFDRTTETVRLPRRGQILRVNNIHGLQVRRVNCHLPIQGNFDTEKWQSPCHEILLVMRPSTANEESISVVHDANGLTTSPKRPARQIAKVLRLPLTEGDSVL